MEILLVQSAGPPQIPTIPCVARVYGVCGPEMRGHHFSGPSGLPPVPQGGGGGNTAGKHVSNLGRWLVK